MRWEEDLLLAVLNSTPVIDGHLVDGLTGASGHELAGVLGGTGTSVELAQLRRARNALQSVIREEEATALEGLAHIIDGSVRMPSVTKNGVAWDLRAHKDDLLAIKVVLAWSSVIAESSGRLRACANQECNLFLIDHSRPGTAKWCSMATCGNRMKARAHANRSNGPDRNSPAGHRLSDFATTL